MKNQAFKFLDDLVIVAHTANPPTEEESRAYLNAFRARDLSRLRCLAFTDGGAPSAAHRRELNEILRGRAFPTAVVSSVPVVRGVVTALSWFNSKIKAFAPEDAEQAFVYLGIPQSDYAKVWVEIRKLSTELGATPLKAIKG